MSFVYPAGLWALLALALPLALALLRRRAELTNVSSAYLWRLAERQRQKKGALRALKRALFVGMQLAAVALAALLIARPALLLPGSGVDVAVVLDASGSMRMRDGAGQTRFERAAQAAQRDMARLPWGASVTVLLAGDTACVAADHVRGGAQLRAALEGAACGWGAGDVQGALSLCQAMLEEGSVSRVLLYTDTVYESAEGLEVVCLRGEDEWNLSVDSLEAEDSLYGTLLTARMTASGRSADVRLELSVDGALREESGITLSVNGLEQAGMTVHCPEGEETAVSLLVRQTYDFSDARLAACVQDGLAEDNEIRLFHSGEKTARVLLVGENPYFWQRALEALPQTELTVADEPGKAPLTGYDIYAFDGCLPERLPRDGAVWLLNPPRSPREAGAVLGRRLTGGYLSGAGTASALAEELTQNLALRDAAVARFFELTAQGALESVLMCGEYTVLAAGPAENGCLRIVMPFDIQESSLPLLPDFVVLVYNMTEASAPSLLPKGTVTCGQSLRLAPHPLCENLFLQTPDRRMQALDPQAAREGVPLALPGSYTLLQEVRGRQRTLGFFAQVPASERAAVPAPVSDPVVLGAGEEPPAKREPRRFDPTRAMALLALALLLAEWGMYHREKY